MLWKSLVLGTIVGTEHQQIVFFSSKSESKMIKIRENNGGGEKEGDWGRGDIKKCRRIEQRKVGEGNEGKEEGEVIVDKEEKRC